MRVVAIGAHPDDVEIGCGGTLARLCAAGHSCSIIDLTPGDMGTNGNSVIRIEESDRAGKIIKIEKRIQLGLSDRRFQINQESIELLAEQIRLLKPDMAFIPYSDDRHPDHNRCHYLCKEAIFDARCRKLSKTSEQWSISMVYEYYINTVGNPMVYFDTSEYIELKKEALLAHKSQFIHEEPWLKTRLNSGFIDEIFNRDKNFGSMVDVDYAEGFQTKQGLLVKDLGCHTKLNGNK